MSWTVERWLAEDEAPADEYAAYWNDPAHEHGKPWDVATGGFGAVERYVAAAGLAEALDSALIHAQRIRGRPLAGTGLDVAAGTLWAAPLILRNPGVHRLVCVEYSKHRLLEIGPMMLEHYGVEPERIILALGSFYDLRLPAKSLDFALLSQAFHHAEHPAELLGELGRVLSRDGVIIITGEHRIRLRQYTHYGVRALTALLPSSLRALLPDVLSPVTWRFPPRGVDIEPTDPVLGDHVYTSAEYSQLFAAAGFRSVALPALGHRSRSFLLFPEDGR